MPSYYNILFQIFNKMPTLNHSMKSQLLLLLLAVVAPPYAAAQDSFEGNSGEPFTPSMIVLIIMAAIFVLTAFLSLFLRQFSEGCFGLNVVPTNPNVTIDGRPVARGLDAEVIKSIPTYFYSDVKQHRKGKVELECAICLSEFLDTEALRLLPGCSHVFHPRCVDPWLVAHVTCPICRHNLEPRSGVTKEQSIINFPVDDIEFNGQDPATLHEDRDDVENDDHDVHLHDIDDDDEKETMRGNVGRFPRSHSTGHSMANSERFTLKLTEEVHNSLVNRSSYADGPLTSTLSPRGSGYKIGIFSLTPPCTTTQPGSVRSLVTAGGVNGGSKKKALRPVKTSERLWPI